MVPGSSMPISYLTTHKNPIRQDEHNLLQMESATKGGEFVSETGGWRSRSNTERYE